MPLFGNKPKAPVEPDVMAAVQEIAAHVGRLQKRKAVTEKRLAAEVAQAKAKAKAKDKRGALMCLKKKKIFEAEREQLDGSIFTLEQQKIMIEQGKMQIETVAALKQAKDMVAQLHAKVNLDDLEDLMDDIQEQQEEAAEIAGVFSRGMGVDELEDEFGAELAELEAEELDRQLVELDGPVPEQPVPQPEPEPEAADEAVLREAIGQPMAA